MTPRSGREGRSGSMASCWLVAGVVMAASLAFLPRQAGAREPTDAARSTEHYRKDYRFTTDWFTHAIPVWKKVLQDYRGKPDIQYLEVGIFEGRSVLWTLENILTHSTARMTTVDVMISPRYLGNLEKSGAAHKVANLEGRSQEILLTLPAESFDIIYLDGSHQGDDVLADAVLAWGLLREGGTLIFDDYQWGEGWADEVRPKVAIDTFVTLFRRSLDVTWREHQLVVRKRKSPCAAIKELYCSRLGNYAYYWRKKALFDSVTGKKVALTESERSTVERLIKGVQIGESSVSIPSELASDPTLIGLRKKLDL